MEHHLQWLSIVDDLLTIALVVGALIPAFGLALVFEWGVLTLILRALAQASGRAGENFPQAR
jgi:hypothetical protein